MSSQVTAPCDGARLSWGCLNNFAVCAAFAISVKPSLCQPTRFLTFILPTLCPISLGTESEQAAAWGFVASWGSTTRVYAVFFYMPELTCDLRWCLCLSQGSILSSCIILVLLLLNELNHKIEFKMTYCIPSKQKAFSTAIICPVLCPD